MPHKVTVQKGDTLNTIAQRFGFSNFREAGITSVPSGNFDLIRAGEEITLENHDPNDIRTIGETAPVISSKDQEQQFRTDSDLIDDITGKLEAQATPTDEGETKKETTPFGTGAEVKDKATGETSIETTGDPLLDSLNKWEKDQAVKFQKEADERIASYNDLFTTSLAAIDATTAATVATIQGTYQKRIREQERINNINISRVKAYGLGGGGRFVPLEFSAAVTNREEEAADKISELENERNTLLAKAKSARDKGEAGLMREQLEDLDKINDDLRDQLADVEKEADEQYKLLRDIRKDEEEKFNKLVEDARKRLVSLAPQFIDEYEKMEQDERDIFINKLATQTGLDYATIFGIMEGASAEDLDKTKKKADIKGVEALTKQREASAEASHALADKRRSEIGEDDSFSDSEKKKLEQAGLLDAERETQLDFLFGDDIEKEEALEKAKDNTSGGVLTSPDGTKQVKVSDLTEAQIKEAKDAGWK